MKTAQFQVFTAQRFPSIDTFMKQADGSEIIIKQEGNMFAFYEGEKKLLESIWQTYAGHRIRNGKHKFLSAYQGRKFVFFHPREDGAIDAIIEIPFFKVRKPVKPFRLDDYVTVEIIKPEEEIVQEEIVAAPVEIVEEPEIVQEIAQIVCPVCGSHEHKKNGKHKKTGEQMYKCKPCGKNFVA